MLRQHPPAKWVVLYLPDGIAYTCPLKPEFQATDAAEERSDCELLGHTLTEPQYRLPKLKIRGRPALTHSSFFRRAYFSLPLSWYQSPPLAFAITDSDP